MGAVIATGLYACLKYVGYWRISPNADSISPKDSALNELHLDKDGNTVNSNGQIVQPRQTQAGDAPGHAHSGVHGMNGTAASTGGTTFPRTSDATFTTTTDRGLGPVMGEKRHTESARSPV